MKPTGSGRIVIWRGASLWIGLAGEPTSVHAHHAVQITLPLAAGRVRFRRPGADWKTFAAAMIAANQPHAFEGRGEFVAMIFVEPESREGRALQQRCLKEGIASLAGAALEREIAALAASYKAAGREEELAACARSVIASLAATQGIPPASLDKRIERAVALVRERIGETVPLAEIAAGAHLSPDRFRHLFLKETGIRFRPYVLWLRIEMALAALKAGRSLTEASHAGGFADSAHFSRTFRRMFGIAPSSFQHE
jgi:AraC family transcriptional regulator